MSALHPGVVRPALAGAAAPFAAAVLASLLLTGCEETLQPFLENEEGTFSMFGYLDLKADTQWVRVMPVRRSLFLGPEPIDAVVTLEHLGSGRTVTLNDSLFRYVDSRLGGEAFAHNFWTTEPLQPEATYRLRAARADGATTTAEVVMPRDLEILFLQSAHDGRVDPEVVYPATAALRVRAEHLLFVERIHTMGRPIAGVLFPAASISIPERGPFAADGAGRYDVAVSALSLNAPDLVDMNRWEIRLVAGRSDWPYHAGLPDVAVTVPDAAPSNVENGLGFVAGVATRTIPFDACEALPSESDPDQPCATRFDAGSAAIAGRVIREPCGDPHALATIRLTEKLPGGGAILRRWKTGWNGQYRFDGIHPDAELLLDPGTGTGAVNVPRLAAGERYAVEDLFVPGGC